MVRGIDSTSAAADTRTSAAAYHRITSGSESTTCTLVETAVVHDNRKAPGCTRCRSRRRCRGTRGPRRLPRRPNARARASGPFRGLDRAPARTAARGGRAGCRAPRRATLARRRREEGVARVDVEAVGDERGRRLGLKVNRLASGRLGDEDDHPGPGQRVTRGSHHGGVRGPREILVPEHRRGEASRGRPTGRGQSPGVRPSARPGTLGRGRWPGRPRLPRSRAKPAMRRVRASRKLCRLWVAGPRTEDGRPVGRLDVIEQRSVAAGDHAHVHTALVEPHP